MAQLIWTGTDEQEQFHDDRRNTTYWPSERPVEVPDDLAERYLEHDGWVEAEDPDEIDVGEVLEEHDRARAQSYDAEVQDEADETPPAETEETTREAGAGVEVTPESDAESESEVNGGDSADSTTNDLDDEEGGFRAASEPEREQGDATADGTDQSVREASSEDGQTDGGFDADQFIDGNWQAVASAIREGAADDHLDAVETAERNRDGEPRENSVLRAIKDRRDSHDATEDADAESSD